jgi:hypothetical protein
MLCTRENSAITVRRRNCAGIATAVEGEGYQGYEEGGRIYMGEGVA